MVAIDDLKRFKLFKGLNDRELELIVKIAKEETVEANVRLFEEKANATDLYLVLEGMVDVKVKGVDDERITIAHVESGQILGWSAIVEPHVRTAGAWIQKKAKLITLRADSLKDLFEKNNHIGYRIMKVIASLISERLKALDTKYAEKLRSAK
jgi:CRP/FNR family cyclic AMP-dependent transcriptional regulator